MRTCNSLLIKLYSYLRQTRQFRQDSRKLHEPRKIHNKMLTEVPKNNLKSIALNGLSVPKIFHNEWARK